MALTKRLLLVGLIIFFCVGCDQLTKSIAVKTLAQQSHVLSYLNGLVRLQYAENPGAFLNFGSTFPEALRFWVFGVGASIFLLIAFFALVKTNKLKPVMRIALAFVIAGGMGNVIDRLFKGGQVVDFLNVGIGPIRTGIFNVADMAITFGAIALLILSFFQRSESGSS